ncbi:hypothetical protein HYALB_00005976 [Hymenoscyphus albidus]|uniref:Carboxymuconolactone decarboxylase-like domain-containing protein n=1 Tax=Hymenoscyphus albidus TaxID=595503 RepID=A0A9N9Q1G4_9HELO|nr:hypothetical protein HYALB_00005976 [Hymenoscyphus albidus]
MFFPLKFWSVPLTVAIFANSVNSLAMELPREAANAVLPKDCASVSRFPPLSPTIGNLSASQAEQYTVIDNALTRFYGNTIVTKNPDGSFTGPFGQLMYTTPTVVQNFINLNVGVAQNLPASENEACVLAILSVIKAPFAIYAHTILGQKAGFTLKQVKSMLAGKCPYDVTPRQAAAYKLAVKITNLRGPLDSASFDEAVSVLGRVGVEGITQQTATSLLAVIMLNVGDIGVPVNA